MDFVLAALALGALAVGAYAATRRAREDRYEHATPATTSDFEERDLGRIEPGDVLLDGASTMVVKEVLRCTDGDYSWTEARLQDAGPSRWLLVNERGPSLVLIGRRIALPSIINTPSRQLEHDGIVYELERWGRASCLEISPRQLRGEQHELRYWNYRALGSQRLWLRRRGDTTACFAGNQRASHEIDLLPHSRSDH